MIVTDLQLLYQKSIEITSIYEAQDIYTILLNEVKQHEDSIGLSAIQIGIPKRCFLTLRLDSQTKTNVWDYYINPIIEESDVEIVDSIESCLSLGKRRFLVKRQKQITVSTLDLDTFKEKNSYILYEQDAIIFQHEIDHLNGIMICDFGIEIGIPRKVEKQIGRNEKCSCKSGKKYKQCCM